jgi:hypothetical protein
MRRAMSVNTSFPNSFIRKGKKEDEFLAVILNFMGVSNEDYKIGITQLGSTAKYSIVTKKSSVVQVE